MKPIMLLTAFILASTLTAAQPNGETATASDDLKVMSFNIRYGTANDGDNRWEHRRELVFGVLREHAPDLIGLQEALRFQLDEIAEALRGYGEIGVGRTDGKTRGEYAAILYRRDRLEPLDSGTFWFSDTPDVPGSTSWGNRITRICTWARFRDRTAGGEFYLYNVHLDHESQPSRERSAAMLSERVAQRNAEGAPVVVTGDFNADEDNPAVLRLTAPSESGQPRFVDTFRAIHPDANEVGTFNAFRGVTTGPKIDYILIQAESPFEVVDASIIRDHDAETGRYPSDHFPVIATLRPDGE